ncbi:MAG: thioredoxin-dependent thiol peroxidase [Pseudomonadota bacterium]
MINEGDTPKNTSLPTDGDGTFSISSYAGKTLVLFFYPKDDTPGCTTEATEFSAKQEEFRALGAVIVGVSPDPVKKHDKFKAKHGLTVTLASDEDHQLLNEFGVWVEKSMYGKKYMGVERSTFVIDASGKVEKVWRKVKVKGHVDAVLEHLQNDR